MVPGQVRTPMAQKCTILPVTSGYEDPDTPAAIGRKIIASSLNPNEKVGDLRRTMDKIYELSLVENPPLRLIIGLDSLGVVRTHLNKVMGELEAYESWSEALKEE